MYCKNCGSQIDDNAVVCPNCGVPTDNYNANNLGKTLNYYQTKQYNVLAIVGFALSFFIAIAGLICSIIGYKNAPLYNGEGKSLALAGIIISCVEIAISLLVVILVIIITIFGLSYGAIYI